ncbi:polymer-forming cytoskeletal protein [Streptomyces ziwulingensis]|uniref:Uncharacterized protein n=1 Tax=Streptomyces ziwulingensis TaxID=1045501 RepID=A0ABP9CP11_9ACTN
MSDQPLLTYRVATSPAPLQAGTAGTNSQGRITITVTAGAEDTYCDWIQIAVPGDAKSGGAYFTDDPKPVFSSDGNWSAGSLVQVSAQHLGLAGDALYYRAIFHYQGDDSEPFDGTLHLGVSGELVDSTGALDLHLTEHSDTSSDPDDFASRRRTVPLSVTEPVFYLNAFLARDDDSATAPKTRFSSDDNPYLSWESNGSHYRVFNGDGAIVYEGSDTFFTLPDDCLAMDTTFTLEASMSPEDVGSGFETIHQYAVLTLTVKNPTLDALTVEGEISGESGLEISGNAAVGNSLVVNNSLAVNGSADVGSSLTVQGNTYTQNSLTVNGSLTAKSGLYSEGSAQVSGDLTVNSTLNANGTLNAYGQVNAVSNDHYVRIRELRGPYSEQLSINSNTELISGCDLNVTGDSKAKGYKVFSNNDTVSLWNNHYSGYFYATMFVSDSRRQVAVWDPGNDVNSAQWRISFD